MNLSLLKKSFACRPCCWRRCMEPLSRPIRSVGRLPSPNPATGFPGLFLRPGSRNRGTCTIRALTTAARMRRLLRSNRMRTLRCSEGSNSFRNPYECTIRCSRWRSVISKKRRIRSESTGRPGPRNDAESRGGMDGLRRRELPAARRPYFFDSSEGSRRTDSRRRGVCDACGTGFRYG